ncbi:ABC transporter ATP-binding protein [Campylobacter troglodytis]|uniref:ABC transporter ATP-binding protein n=1 Tax=Campylobacter troglodytis TaxID=654363 RepID=UPI001157E354|nr:ABC transporter ATP-binding protein [Campylobacter troglodytis]TQR60528.1 ABC transporter ATP-binding protein [Campylobacter troglodytis]
MTLLKAQNLSHSFDYVLFQNLNLELFEKDCIAIQGSSGCGKSTLLHILSSLLRPKFGKIFFQNYDLYELNENERLHIRRYFFGIIFQMHYLFKGFSALENIELATVLSKAELDNSLLERLGIYELLGTKIGKLSGGQQQRVSIARVLCKKPKIIFADEATGNLDSDNAKNVINILKSYVKENSAALLFVTHDNTLASMCDTIYKIDKNGLIKV